MSPGAVDFAVPAYFYPVGHEEDWQILTAGRHPLRYVVVNPHDGPGAATDPAYQAVTSRLSKARVRMLGYVDTDYGSRSVDDVIADARLYRERYNITGIFLDQTSSGIDMLTHFENYSVALRTVGTRFIVMNPGTYPHRGYFRIANQIVCFEGTWKKYRDLEPPDWSLNIPAPRIAHYVWAVPPAFATDPVAAVGQKHVGTIVLSTRKLPNPWGGLPPALRQVSDPVPRLSPATD